MPRWRPMVAEFKGARPRTGTHCLADDAVSCELVSAPNSLLTGKLTGNFAESEPSATILTFNQRANSKACRQIPYATEQGNFAAITGNFFGITGNLIERAGKALSCCRSRISTTLDVNSWHFCGIARSVDFPPLAEERVQRTSPAMRQN